MRDVAWRIFGFGAELLGELVGPSGCVACDEELSGRRMIFCSACGGGAEPYVHVDQRGVISCFAYGGAIATAIARFKYRGRSEIGVRLGRLMVESVGDLALERSHDLVLPVPLHPIRLAERGYNQSLLLARPIARRLRLPLLPHALRRIRHTPRQVSLDRYERLNNLYDAFEFGVPRKSPDIRDARILLIDDVCTTGATLDGCARALIEARARSVHALVLARSAHDSRASQAPHTRSDNKSYQRQQTRA